MHQFITQYISECNKLYRAGNATEHSYRPALKTLLETLTNFTATNEPKRIACGAPDYIITDRNFAVGYVEANEAAQIKRDTPVMVILGNPPYSVSSSNKGKWIADLCEDYKKGLNERNIQPLSDDYIKFIRLGQHYIEKNGFGILAYISNNSFIDGLIHRQMRKNLLETFDKIYILDLHGNAKKKETAPDDSEDKNVFDIQQGVSINIFVKLKKD